MSSNISCKSCGNSFKGNYCNTCGEKVIKPEDRKIKYFLQEFVNALTFADNKLWRTLKIILKKPGTLSKEFAEGRRKPFMKPVSIFFLANLIYFLFPLINTFTTPLDIQKSAFSYSRLVTEWVENEVTNRELTYEKYETIYNAKTAELSKLLLIIFAILMSILFSIIHLGGNRKFFADHLTVSLELMTFILLAVIQLSGLLALLLGKFGLNFLLSNRPLTSISILALSYFFYLMEKNFYGFRSARAIVNTLLCIGAISVTLITYRAILFFVTYWSI